MDKYIRLAYADSVTGPWEIYSPGTLRLEQTPFVGHIASPNVHVDDDNELIRLYYHGETRIRDLVGTAGRNTDYRRDHYNYRPRSLPHRVLFETGRYLVNTLETKTRRQTIQPAAWRRHSSQSVDHHDCQSVDPDRPVDSYSPDRHLGAFLAGRERAV